MAKWSQFETPNSHSQEHYPFHQYSASVNSTLCWNVAYCSPSILVSSLFEYAFAILLCMVIQHECVSITTHKATVQYGEDEEHISSSNVCVYRISIVWLIMSITNRLFNDKQSYMNRSVIPNRTDTFSFHSHLTSNNDSFLIVLTEDRLVFLLLLCNS